MALEASWGETAQLNLNIDRTVDSFALLQLDGPNSTSRPRFADTCAGTFGDAITVSFIGTSSKTICVKCDGTNPGHDQTFNIKTQLTSGSWHPGKRDGVFAFTCKDIPDNTVISEATVIVSVSTRSWLGVYNTSSLSWASGNGSSVARMSYGGYIKRSNNAVAAISVSSLTNVNNYAFVNAATGAVESINGLHQAGKGGIYYIFLSSPVIRNTNTATGTIVISGGVTGSITAPIGRLRQYGAVSNVNGTVAINNTACTYGSYDAVESKNRYVIDSNFATFAEQPTSVAAGTLIATNNPNPLGWSINESGYSYVISPTDVVGTTRLSISGNGNSAPCGTNYNNNVLGCSKTYQGVCVTAKLNKSVFSAPNGMMSDGSIAPTDLYISGEYQIETVLFCSSINPSFSYYLSSTPSYWYSSVGIL
jgi:hypothetical protein